MRAGGVGSVVKSNSQHLKVGDRVSGTLGWQQYAVVKDGQYEKLPSEGENLDYLGVLGSSGQTAYCEFEEGDGDGTREENGIEEEDREGRRGNNGIEEDDGEDGRREGGGMEGGREGNQERTGPSLRNLTSR